MPRSSASTKVSCVCSGMIWSFVTMSPSRLRCRAQWAREALLDDSSESCEGTFPPGHTDNCLSHRSAAEVSGRHFKRRAPPSQMPNTKIRNIGRLHDGRRAERASTIRAVGHPEVHHAEARTQWSIACPCRRSSVASCVKRADDIFAKEGGDANLTPRQFAVLLTVAESNSPSQTDLVQDTGIDRSTIADMVRRMVQNGLLQRKRSRQDARAYVVQLTETGRRALNATQRNARRADTAFLTPLSGEQRKAFVESLTTISSA
jgi:DNA-binding MarR family transcriptional regulator